MTVAAPYGDAVQIDVAARLIGLTSDRVRQLVRAGHATSPERGRVSLSSLLRGYTATLRAEAARPASAALARHQLTKAELIEQATAQRRDELFRREDVANLIEHLAEAAEGHLKAMARPANLRGVPADISSSLRNETKDAIAKIGAAREIALAALASGNFGEIDG